MRDQDARSFLPKEWRSAVEPPEPDYPSLEHFATPVDDGYVALVGQAAYAFTYLEWQTVSLAEKIAPGFVDDADKLTAGQIGTSLASEVNAFGGAQYLKADLAEFVAKFVALVHRRNDLFHAHPATIRGEQRLHRRTSSTSFTWEPNEIVKFVREIEALAREGNRLYYDPRMGTSTIGDLRR